MPLEHHFTCPLPNGLHARPATQFAALAGRYGAEGVLLNLRNGYEADCASVIELVAAGVMHSDECLLKVSGAQEAEAFNALVEFIDTQLAYCDTELPQARQLEGCLPRALSAYESSCLRGIPLSAGIARGPVLQLSGATLPLELLGQIALDPQAEQERIARALDAVDLELSAQLEQAGSETEAEILRANLALLRDRALSARLIELIGAALSAPSAVVEVLEALAQELGESDSAYLRERSADLRGIGLLLLAQMGVQLDAVAIIQLSRPCIVVAAALAPSQLLALDRERLLGLVLSEAGATSHAAILARSFGIPAVAGLSSARNIADGTAVRLDAGRGLLFTDINADLERFYEIEAGAARRRLERDRAAASGPAQSRDGRRLEIAANIASAREAEAALSAGAEGIGLFRTEMLFYERAEPPTEDEQFELYRATLEQMQRRPVIFRTLDIGGDKPLDYLRLPREANPFLGQRGIRLYARHSELIDTQVRALLRASAYSPADGLLRLMAPMVSTVAEAADFRARVTRLAAELRAAGHAVADQVPVGVMIEVPAAALLIDKLAPHCDFFSIGSNDLGQYCFAADRGNPAVSRLARERDPAFLRLLRLACDSARAAGRWIGLCGEMAGDTRNLPLLLGLGLDELSMSGPRIAGARSALRRLDNRACRELLERACDCRDAGEVEEVLRGAAATDDAALLAAELIVLDSAALSKAEAIHELVQLLYGEGRTEDPDALEDSVWAREETYSTGLGHGFAVPHCKSSAASCASLAVLRPRAAIDWGSPDGEPAACVILLAMPERQEGNEHLKVFAALARKLMHEDFRDALLTADSPAGVIALLGEHLNLNPGEVQT